MPIIHVDPRAPFDDTIRILPDDYPRLPYDINALLYYHNIHWGQLKLMACEVEFLTIVYQEYRKANETRPIYFVYAGAAPGHHIEELHHMFPEVNFILYDPNEFHVKPNDKITIYKDFFFEDNALEWSSERHPDKYIVFNTDIRTSPSTEEIVAENMELQKMFWMYIKPELAMFKFRLPWDDGKTIYMDGDIYLQVYPRGLSAETRLIVRKNAGWREYDNRKYEEQCFYFNNITKKKRFRLPSELGNHLSLQKDHIDNCYDCATFAHIIKEYLKIMPNNMNLKQLVRHIQDTIVNAENVGKTTQQAKDIIKQTIHDHNTKIRFLRRDRYIRCDNEKCNICRYQRPESEGQEKHEEGEALRKMRLERIANIPTLPPIDNITTIN